MGSEEQLKRRVFDRRRSAWICRVSPRWVFVIMLLLMSLSAIGFGIYERLNSRERHMMKTEATELKQDLYDMKKDIKTLLEKHKK